MTHREIHNPASHFLEATLLGKQHTWPELQACFDGQDVQLASSLEYRGVRYGKGQYKAVLTARKAVLIQAAAQSQDSIFLLGNLLTCIEHKTVGFSQWQQEDDSTGWWIIPLAEIAKSVHASFFRQERKGNATIVSLLHF